MLDGISKLSIMMLTVMGVSILSERHGLEGTNSDRRSPTS